MKRGELWWAWLQAPTGSGSGYRRPVLVVQSNPFNKSGIAKPSVVNVSQLLTLDRNVFTERVRALPAELMRSIDEGLRLAWAL